MADAAAPAHVFERVQDEVQVHPRHTPFRKGGHLIQGGAVLAALAALLTMKASAMEMDRESTTRISFPSSESCRAAWRRCHVLPTACLTDGLKERRLPP